MNRILLIFSVLLATQLWAAGHVPITLVLEHHKCAESRTLNESIRTLNLVDVVLACREGIVEGSDLESIFGLKGIENQAQLDFVGHYMRLMETNLLIRKGQIPELESYSSLAQKWLGPLKSEDSRRQWKTVKKKFMALDGNYDKQATILPVEQLMNGDRLVLSDVDRMMTNLVGFEALSRTWAEVATEEAKRSFPEVDFRYAEQLLSMKSMEPEHYVAFHEKYNFDWRELSWTKSVMRHLESLKNASPQGGLVIIIGALHAKSFYDKITHALEGTYFQNSPVLIDDSILEADCMKGPVTGPAGDKIRESIKSLPKSAPGWLDILAEYAAS